MSDLTIHQIEALKESDVLAMNPEKVTINGHEVYFVDLGGYFGFSALVFRDHKHIYYANDYALHHNGKSREELRAYYAERLPEHIFTDSQLLAPSVDYTEKENKRYYLLNYYPQLCADRVSAFQIFHNDGEKVEFSRKTAGMIYCPNAFIYTNNKAFVDRFNDLLADFEKAQEPDKNNYGYWFSAFKYEMNNHEYAINWDADADTLSAFGNIPRGVESLEKLFEYLHFSDVQKSAYYAAARDVMSTANY